MDDLIRRQDAIEAMCRLEAEDIERYGCSIPEGFDAKPAVEALEALSSAEPERIIKIGQRSGKALESAIDYLHSVGWLQEHDRILTESVKPEPKWIPVTEALPEECVSVLIQMDDGEMAVSQRRDMNYWDGYGRCGDIIAWMPLPEPWRGE